MMYFNRPKSILLLCVLGLAMLAGDALGAAQSAASDPLQLVPAESLFCVRINKLNASLGQVDQFLAGLLPFNASMLVQSQLAQMLGTPDPNGVVMNGDFALFGPLPGGDTPDPSRIGILVPVSNYQKFAKGNPNVTAPDASGLSLIGPEGQQMLVATNVGSYALMTTAGNRQALTEVKSWMPKGATSLAQRLAADEAKRAQSSAVWLYANVQTAQKMFGPMLQAKIQEAKQAVEQAQQGQGQASPMPGNMGAMMDTYAGLLNTLMQETQSASLSLDPSATALRLELAVAALPQTNMAKALVGGPTTVDNSFAKYLQNGALANFLVAVEPATWGKINDMSIDMLAQMAGVQKTDPEIQKIRKFAADGTAALSGTLAGSMSVDTQGKPPFVIRYVAGLKDAQAMSRLLQQMPTMFNSGLIANFYQKMGMKMNVELQQKAETYKGVPIDAIKFGFSAADANSPEAQMISSMYGQGMNIRVAMVNNLILYAAAADPASAIHALIDQVKSPAANAQVPSEVQAATKLLPGSEKADFFVTYNILRQIQMISAVAPVPIPQIEAKSQSNIALAGNIADGKLGIQLAIPKQQVQELMGAFMQMQQQRMQQQQQGGDEEKKSDDQEKAQGEV
ncbi:MAG: hypothetical protein ACM3VT_12940 [Solirubrobacterales bacterium]